jgi:hypothetical protein
MVGQHSLWSILQENSNYALNEMFPEMWWPDDDRGPQLLLYNRIKPFSYTKDPASDKIDSSMRSMFQLIAHHKLDDEAIIHVDAGTNWRDKFNFLEIKPDINELGILGGLLKYLIVRAFVQLFSLSNNFLLLKTALQIQFR